MDKNLLFLNQNIYAKGSQKNHLNYSYFQHAKHIVHESDKILLPVMERNISISLNMWIIFHYDSNYR